MFAMDNPIGSATIASISASTIHDQGFPNSVCSQFRIASGRTGLGHSDWSKKSLSTRQAVVAVVVQKLTPEQPTPRAIRLGQE